MQSNTRIAVVCAVAALTLSGTVNASSGGSRRAWSTFRHADTSSVESLTRYVNDVPRSEIDPSAAPPAGAGSVTGTVIRPDGTRGGNAYIFAIPNIRTPQGQMLRGRADANGVFIFMNIGVGPYWLVVSEAAPMTAAQPVWYALLSITITNGGTTTVTAQERPAGKWPPRRS